MKEEKKIMSEEDFKEYLDNSFNPRFFDGNNRFRSIKRAYHRGLLDKYGFMLPKRPFNNRKNRKTNELAKSIYFSIKANRKK